MPEVIMPIAFPYGEIISINYDLPSKVSYIEIVLDLNRELSVSFDVRRISRIYGYAEIRRLRTSVAERVIVTIRFWQPGQFSSRQFTSQKIKEELTIIFRKVFQQIDSEDSLGRLEEAGIRSCSECETSVSVDTITRSPAGDIFCAVCGETLVVYQEDSS